MGRRPTAAHSRRLHYRYRQEILYDPGVYTQTLEAWDYYDNYAKDVREGLVVDPDGSECYER
jgi:hypothetical protein